MNYGIEWVHSVQRTPLQMIVPVLYLGEGGNFGHSRTVQKNQFAKMNWILLGHYRQRVRAGRRQTNTISRWTSQCQKAGSKSHNNNQKKIKTRQDKHGKKCSDVSRAKTRLRTEPIGRDYLIIGRYDNTWLCIVHGSPLYSNTVPEAVVSGTHF